MKKAKKNQTPKAHGAIARTRAGAKKIGKKLLVKSGLNKAAVKKKVVTKLKRVGVAMARAAMDELMPENAPAAAPGSKNKPAAAAGAANKNSRSRAKSAPSAQPR